jgi:hypothetical protein
MDNIVKIIEGEISEQVSKRLSEFMVRVSKDFKIPVRLLIRYLEEPDTDTGLCNPQRCCLGVKKVNGRPCDKKPKENGYCGHHKDQVKVLQKPIVIVNDVAAPHRVHVPSRSSGVIDMNLIRV